MELYEHAFISAVAAPIAAWQLYGFGSLFPLIAFYGFCCGVFIDLDHFLVQRLRDGNWNHLHTAFNSFTELAKDNVSALDQPISEKSRYLAHFTVLAVAPVIATIGGLKLAALTYTMLASHIFCDILRTWNEGNEVFDRDV